MLLVFNPQEVTSRVISAIRPLSPDKLYVALLSKDSRTEDVVPQIDWQCSIDVLQIKNDNEKLAEAAGVAIDYFFEKEEEGIVLHDNCLPSESFFGFCSAMLDKYRKDERIGQVGGVNVQNGVSYGDGNYYFSALTQIKAWASWRRVWNHVKESILKYPLIEMSDFLSSSYSYKPFKQLWLKCFKVANFYAPDFWNINFIFHNIVNNRLSIVPNVNMIETIGVDYPMFPFKNELPSVKFKTGNINEILSPSMMYPNVCADHKTQVYEFDTSELQEVVDDGFLFLKGKLLNSSKVERKIPQIIHQIYVCKDSQGKIPEDLLELSKTWRSLHPNWEYRFWNKESIDDFLKDYYPDFIPYYYGFPYDVQRWDSIRYLILYHFGGLYVDMDYECIEPIDSLLNNSTCCMGLEPSEHAVDNKKNIILGNALMASVPRHPYFDTIIKTIKQGEKRRFPNKALQVMETTGPFMLTRMYENYPNKDEITLLPAELLSPLCIYEVQNLLRGKMNKVMEKKIERAFAIHYFGGSWHSQTSE